jgi:D-alanine-D-alanine ligase
MMRTGRRIGVLLGGLSSERELSLQSGEAVHAALVERGHDAVKVFVDRDLDLVLRAQRVEVAFLALHGRYGEDGCVQGLLELVGIPYTGSSVLASALAMDKLKAKELFRLHNLPTPPGYLYRRGDGAPAQRHGGFGFPAVVKPRGAGSSLGVTRVGSADELAAALEDALGFDEHALVERCIDGCAVHVALLDGRALGAVEALGEPGRRARALHLPPRLSPERLRGVLHLAERAARALEASGLVAVDLMVSDEGNEFVLEVDTQPSLAPRGLMAKVAAAAGRSFGALIEAMLDGARLHARARGAAEGAAAPLAALLVDRRPASEPH